MTPGAPPLKPRRCYSARMTRLLLTALLLGLSACASTDRERAQDALTAPLSDLNVIRTAIPPVLIDAVEAPYRVPLEPGCQVMLDELAALQEALGPDIAAQTPGEPGLIERGKDEARNAAFGLLQRTTQDVLPYRSWLRKLSGAEQHSEAVAQAVVAGTSRRGFLKGLAISQDCPIR